MRINFKYLRPHSLNECLAVLLHMGTRSAILAGGTDLMISLRSGSRTPKFVLDISRLSEIRSVEQHAEVIKIGAVSDIFRIDRSSFNSQDFSSS